MIGPTMRMGYAALLIVYVIVWMIDSTRWFSDEGVLTVETARRLVEHVELGKD